MHDPCGYCGGRDGICPPVGEPFDPLCQWHELIFAVTRFDDGLSIVEDYRPEWDIIFLDICMTHMDGMEAAKRVRKRDELVALIFITSMAQYAIHGYEVDALDFILKPVNYPQLSLRLDKVIRLLGRDDQHWLILPAGEGWKRVSVQDILYIEVQNHNVQKDTSYFRFSETAEWTKPNSTKFM